MTHVNYGVASISIEFKHSAVGSLLADSDYGLFRRGHEARAHFYSRMMNEEIRSEASGRFGEDTFPSANRQLPHTKWVLH